MAKNNAKPDTNAIRSAASRALAAERSSQADLMARKRALGRDLTIPPCKNPRRRRRCEADPALFLRTYFPDIFYNPFSENQLEIIQAFEERVTHGGWKAVAAPRGEGKSMLARCTAIRALLTGRRKFVVMVGANSPDAEQALGTIKAQLETNDLLLEDYPEVCAPIRALDGAPQRAGRQTVNGLRTRMKWQGDLLVFPTIEGSPASSAIICCRGIESPIRGINHEGRRPDLVLIDDCETRESAKSSIETSTREDVVMSDVVGLPGPDKSIAILYLCTIWRAGCLADRFTDIHLKPAWQGSRLCLMKQKPLRDDLWAKYMEMRNRAQLEGDPHGRAAHRFYLENRVAMEEGAIITNPHRFNPERLPDGTQKQVSALQFCYDIVCDDAGGWTHFNTEFQNMPPDDDAAESINLDAAKVQKTIDGRDRGTVIPDCEYICAGIDVHPRHLEWTVWGFRSGSGYCIDYGAKEVHSPLTGSLMDKENLQAIQNAILSALCEIRDQFSDGWPDAESGEVRHLNCCLVDSGYMADAVYEFVRLSDPQFPKIYRAAKGFGTGRGKTRYRQPGKRGQGRRIGEHWYASRLPADKIWLYHLDDDHWKQMVQTGFKAMPDPKTHNWPHGSLVLFGKEPSEHRFYAQHICAEEWQREFEPGKGYSEYWKPLRKDNHWLDATKMARIGAAIMGMKAVSPTPKPTAEVEDEGTSKPKPLPAPVQRQPAPQPKPQPPKPTPQPAPQRGGRQFFVMNRFSR